MIYVYKMTDFWNRSNLSKPVKCQLKVHLSKESSEILHVAKEILKEWTIYLSQQKHLESEYCVLSRLLYKKHGQMRREKYFHGLKQVHRLLKRFWNMDLLSLVREFHEDLQNAVIVEGIGVYLPSKQTWEYLLIRMMGASALVASITKRCISVFLLVYKQLSTGNLIPASMVFLALLSRLWTCCQSMSVQFQSWYSKLWPVRQILAFTQVNWLPDSQELPENLTKWLESLGVLSEQVQQTARDVDMDDWTLLINRYQQTSSNLDLEEEDEMKQGLPKELDSLYHESLKDEDLGEPVTISDVDEEQPFPENKSEDDEETSENHKICIRKRFHKALRKRANTASTVRDLQLVLKKYENKFLQDKSSKRHKTCKLALKQLQQKAQKFERLLKTKKRKNVINHAREKVLKFLKVSLRRALS